MVSKFTLVEMGRISHFACPTEIPTFVRIARCQEWDGPIHLYLRVFRLDIGIAGKYRSNNCNCLAQGRNLESSEWVNSFGTDESVLPNIHLINCVTTDST